MELSGFSSLFELFFSVNIAYVISEQFPGSIFITKITENILNKYRSVNEALDEINNRILGTETSLLNLSPPKGDLEKIESVCKKHAERIKGTKEKYILSKKEIESQIKESYQTKSFSFIALFLSLYCVVALIFCGISSLFPCVEFDCFLFCYSILSFIYLIILWTYDSPVLPNYERSPGFLHKFAAKIVSIFKINGYLFTIYISLLILIISPFACYVPKTSTAFYQLYHTIVIIFVVILPMLNSIVYFIKASNRADIIRENLLEKVNSMNTDYSSELNKVEEFLSACALIEQENFSIY